MDEHPYKAPQSRLESRFTLTCCHCWKQFEIYGEIAERTRAFYAAQQNHSTEKEVGVCDECWAKCTKPDDNPYIAPQTGTANSKRQHRSGLPFWALFLIVWFGVPIVVWIIFLFAVEAGIVTSFGD